LYTLAPSEDFFRMDVHPWEHPEYNARNPYLGINLAPFLGLAWKLHE